MSDYNKKLEKKIYRDLEMIKEVIDSSDYYLTDKERADLRAIYNDFIKINEKLKQYHEKSLKGMSEREEQDLLEKQDLFSDLSLLLTNNGFNCECFVKELLERKLGEQD